MQTIDPQALTIITPPPAPALRDTPPTQTRLLDQVRAAAGLPNLHWHDLRRSYGTWLLQSGSASLADVRDLLGHGDIKTTSIYLATARKDLTKAVSGLPELGEARGKKKRSNNTRKTA